MTTYLSYSARALVLSTVVHLAAVTPLADAHPRAAMHRYWRIVSGVQLAENSDEFRVAGESSDLRFHA